MEKNPESFRNSEKYLPLYPRAQSAASDVLIIFCISQVTNAPVPHSNDCTSAKPSVSYMVDEGTFLYIVQIRIEPSWKNLYSTSKEHGVKWDYCT